MTENIRDVLGRVVRETWVKYCIQTGRTDKPSHLVLWDQLDEWNKEVDRLIGDAVAREVKKLWMQQQMEMFDDEVMG